MFSTKHTEICLLLLISLSISFIRTSSENNKDNKKYMEVEEIFDQIEENQKKLKKVIFNDVLEEEVSEGRDCRCVPFYLCNSGKIVKDGSFLLESRYSSPCEDLQEIYCCTPYHFNNSASIKAADEEYSECGYGTSETIDNDDYGSTKFGEFPWTVIIYEPKTRMYVCVGSLIHPEVVLTAAHCVNTTDNYVVRAGEWNLKENNEPVLHQNGKVTRIIKHPKFSAANLFYDVALLIMEKPFQLNKGVNTACLTNPTPFPLTTHSDKCIVTGWGSAKSNEPFSNIMKIIEFSLLPYEQCQESFRTTRLGKWFELHQTFLCAFGLHGSDACAGNGGASLICPVFGEPKRYQQVGINSWGIGCAENQPSVFTKIAQIKGWIDEEFEQLGYSKSFYTNSNTMKLM